MEELNKTLHDLQQKLKVPKAQYNSFGKYYYRSCEDIMETVKGLLPDGVQLILTDEIKGFGDRVFVISTANLFNDKDSILGSGCAECASSKKGMDLAQITGAASSYARKYALNGMFLINDTKDADTDEHKKQSDALIKTQEAEEKEAEKKAKEERVKAAQKWVDGMVIDIITCKDYSSLDKITKDKKFLNGLKMINDTQRAKLEKAVDDTEGKLK